MKHLKSIGTAFLLATPLLALPDAAFLVPADTRDRAFLQITALSEAEIAAQLADFYLNCEPAISLTEGLSLETGQRIQAAFIEQLRPHFGKRVGYKAGLTNAIAQERFQVSQPLRGELLAQMLLPSGSTVRADFGARPFFEGDLMVRVGSETINDATTPQEALAALDAVIPFLELPDLVYGAEAKLDGTALVAINVGARFGVTGEPIPLAATQEWEERLGNVRVILRDREGNELAQGESKALLGHPLQVVLWLKDSLRASGRSLQKGNLLSLGTITPLIPAEPGTTIRAQYLGLDPNQTVEVSVHFQ